VELLAAAWKVQDVLNILYVALGLGLVIFIHELGHFAVAKWCNVKVERFSIGFGPVIWKYTSGETEYALSAIPFGGYVKMLGQDDADPGQQTDDRIAKDPRSYTSKTVPQRMAIISAGVFNNMVSAVGFFIVAFMLGVQYQPAVIGQVVPGKPAWVAGLRMGDHITRVSNREDQQLRFVDIRQAVALSQEGVPVVIEGKRNGKPFKTEIVPEAPGKDNELLFPTIFAEGAIGTTLPVEEEGDSVPLTSPGSPAASASPPFQGGDEIREIDGQTVGGYADLQRLLSEKRDRTVEIAVRRKDAPKEAPLTKITVGPNHFRTIGVRMAIGKISAIQADSPAKQSGFLVGDTITHVAVGADIDPLKLPDYFAEHHGQEVSVKIKREVSGGNPVVETLTVVPDDRGGWTERPVLPRDCPLSVPALGIAFHVLHHVVYVEPGSPADKAGIRKDDNIQKLEFRLEEQGKQKNGDDGKVEIQFAEDQRNWASAFWLMQELPRCTLKLTVKSQGDSAPRNVELVPESDSQWYLPMRGMRLQQLMMERKAANIGEAVSLGFRDTRDSVIDMWLTIKGLTSGRISARAVGGPIRIAKTAYYFANQGIADLILFLGMLSVSLAVLNFLPVPVLDGGHFVFLCWEGIRGKPPSEKVVVAATYFGLALVLSLMAFVVYMDLRN
jgi:regulator of sigma E protease